MELRTTLTLIAVIGLLFVILPVAAEAFFRFRRGRAVTCPRTGTTAEVAIDAWHAAATAVPGPPRLHAIDCSLWPEHADCARDCIDHPELR
jgi:hypothetical protein